MATANPTTTEAKTEAKTETKKEESVKTETQNQEQAALVNPKPNQPDRFANAEQDGIIDGEEVLLTAVHGRIIHPLQVPLEFNPGEITPVTVDSWVRFQYEAGKLAKVEKGARKG